MLSTVSAVPGASSEIRGNNSSVQAPSGQAQPRVKVTGKDLMARCRELVHENHSLRRQVERFRDDNIILAGECEALERKCKEHRKTAFIAINEAKDWKARAGLVASRSELAVLQSEDLDEENTQLERALDDALGDIDQLHAAIDSFDELKNELDHAQEQYEKALAYINLLIEEYKELKAQRDQYFSEAEELTCEAEELNDENDDLRYQYDGAMFMLEQVSVDSTTALGQYTQTVDELLELNSKLKEEVQEYASQHDEVRGKLKQTEQALKNANSKHEETINSLSFLQRKIFAASCVLACTAAYVYTRANSESVINLVGWENFIRTDDYLKEMGIQNDLEQILNDVAVAAFTVAGGYAFAWAFAALSAFCDLVISALPTFSKDFPNKRILLTLTMAAVYLNRQELISETNQARVVELIQNITYGNQTHGDLNPEISILV